MRTASQNKNKESNRNKGMNKRDAARINKQEQRDFDTTKKILQKLYHNHNTTFKKMPEFSPSDMRYSVECKSGNTYLYNVEIKSRNQDMNRYNTLPLKVSKYQRLVADTKDGERLLYIVLLNDVEYFIFDLDSVDFTTIEKRKWKIQLQEYNEGGSDYIEVPTYFIPAELAVNNGLIYK